MPVNPQTTARKLVSLPRTLLAAVKDFRFDRRIASESQAMRRLFELGLKAAASDKPELTPAKSARRVARSAP